MCAVPQAWLEGGIHRRAPAMAPKNERGYDDIDLYARTLRNGTGGISATRSAMATRPAGNP